MYENIDPLFIASLFYTESKFDDKAISPKGYKGIAQTKIHTPYTDVNILLGIKIYKEKLKQANGNFYEAVRLYKGFPLHSKKWQNAVQEVFDIYNSCKDK